MKLVDWTSYDRWNDAVAETIYPEVDDAAPVYLDLEDDLLTEVASHAGWSGDARDGLCAVVRDAVVRDQVFTLAALDRRLRQWGRGDRAEPPPILAFLALSVQAAED